MGATTTFFSAQISTQHHLPSFGSNRSWHSSSKSPIILVRASSSTSTVDKQDEEESSSSTPSNESQPISSIPFGGCKGCGKAEVGMGCNGEGRIQGGIATVPGFGWWPIKAYRPCPDFVATGGRYRRQGQSMDEVAGFGSVPKKSPAPAPAAASATATTTSTMEETQPSDKKKVARKFKK